MNTIKIFMVSLLTLALTSCNLDMAIGQVTGNGNVQTEERPVTEAFYEVRGSAGLDVYLTEGDSEKIVVEADENLLDIIETEIKDGKLIIRTDKNIGRSKSKKVHVTYTRLSTIEASSGADVFSNSPVNADEITLDASSGADLEVEVHAQKVYAESSSGADLKVSGTTKMLTAKASSGSDIKAGNLVTEDCDAKASSGADIVVHVTGQLDGKASSGGDIKYYGNPAAVNKTDGHSGSIRKM